MALVDAWIVEGPTWQWILWSTSAFAVLVEILGFLISASPTVLDCSVPTSPAGTQGKGSQGTPRRPRKRP